MNPELDKLHPYPFEKLSALKSSVTANSELEHIALSIGEPKHQAPEFVMQELHQQLSGVSAYPLTKGIPELRKAITDWLTQRFNLPKESLNAEHHVIPVNGTREALFAFAQAVIDRNQNPLIVMPNPFYQIYEGAAYLSGAEPFYINTTAENNYLADFDSVSDDTWAQCQLLYICSPGNPTGAVIDKTTLQKLIKLADKHDFIIASDECYSEIYFDENIILFTEILKNSGYITGGFFSAIYLKSIYGFSRGFDIYSKEISRKCDEITKKAIEWIEPNKNGKFFLFIHYFDVHWPYLPPKDIAKKFNIDISVKKPFRHGRFGFLRNFSDPVIKMDPEVRKKIINLYDAEIFGVDRSIGKLISYLKKEEIYNKTVLIITSDHGEEFKEHESFGHFHQLYSELINVPLIIRYPKKIKGNLVVNDPVSSVDIATTILNLASIEVPDQFKKYGINLLDIIKKNKKGVKNSDRTIISETRKGGTFHFAARRKGFKYITPYKYLPLRKEKRWVRVSDKLYKVPEDRSNLNNILLSVKGKLNNSVILELLKNNISDYVKNNIRGIRIIFFPPKNNIGKKLSGELMFNLSPGDYPFGVNFDSEDRIDIEKGSNLYKFKLSLGKGKKEIIFPLSDKILNNIEMRFFVSSSEEILVNKKIDITELKKPFFLYKGNDMEGSIHFSIIRKGRSGKKIKLPDKDLKVLKTLGYIN